METRPYKVAFATGKGLFASRFFDEESAAREFMGQIDQPAALMVRTGEGSGDYNWKLLPGGESRKIKALQTLSSDKALVAMGLVILAFLLVRFFPRKVALS